MEELSPTPYSAKITISTTHRLQLRRGLKGVPNRSEAVDSSNNLWAGDLGNNRVLRFNAATTAGNGASASIVLGQVDFTTAAATNTASGLSGPAVCLAFDTAGRLYISDYFNNRVVIFNSPQTIATGGAADLVLGQPAFGSSTALVSASGMTKPYEITYTSGSLWVADSGANRVLRFATTPGSPALSNSPTNPKVTSGKSKTYTLLLTNNGAPDIFSMQNFISSTSKKKAKAITYSVGGVDITSALTAGTFATPLVPSGGGYPIAVKVTARKKIRKALSTLLSTPPLKRFRTANPNSPRQLKRPFWYHRPTNLKG